MNALWFCKMLVTTNQSTQQNIWQDLASSILPLWEPQALHVKTYLCIPLQLRSIDVIYLACIRELRQGTDCMNWVWVPAVCMDSESQLLHWDRLPAVWTELEYQMFALRPTTSCLNWVSVSNVCTELVCQMFALRPTANCLNWVRVPNVCTETLPVVLTEL